MCDLVHLPGAGHEVSSVLGPVGITKVIMLFMGKNI